MIEAKQVYSKPNQNAFNIKLKTIFLFDFGDGNWRQAEAWNLLLAWLGWTPLPKERNGDSLSGRGSNT